MDNYRQIITKEEYIAPAQTFQIENDEQIA